jgi:hypothetical protein
LLTLSLTDAANLTSTYAVDETGIAGAGLLLIGTVETVRSCQAANRRRARAETNSSRDDMGMPARGGQIAAGWRCFHLQASATAWGTCMRGGCHSPPIDYQTLATKCFPADSASQVSGVRVRAHGKETVVAYVTYVEDLTSRTWSPFVIQYDLACACRESDAHAFSSFRFRLPRARIDPIGSESN